MKTFIDTYSLSLNKHGEELCGDKVKIHKTREKIYIVLSDGLGSGVKANILATLTTEIIITMLRENSSLKDVIETVIGTLPVCRVRKIAYSTFTIIEITRKDGWFKVINFDNPPVFFLKKGREFHLAEKTEVISDKKVTVSSGILEKGDFLGIASDGILFASPSASMNLKWNWDAIARYIESLFKRRVYSAHSIVNSVVTKTRINYEYEIGDDATFIGAFVRERKSLMVFTGPPVDVGKDYVFVNKLLDFPGRKVVCGGTTGNLVASFLKEKIITDMSTQRPDIPPIGKLKQVDLVTEGVVTLAHSLETIKLCGGDLSKLPADKNGAYLLTRELLLSDDIFFQVGQQINTSLQNPLLPSNISIRRNLIEQISAVLSGLGKDVHVEYC